MKASKTTPLNAAAHERRRAVEDALSCLGGFSFSPERPIEKEVGPIKIAVIPVGDTIILTIYDRLPPEAPIVGSLSFLLTEAGSGRARIITTDRFGQAELRGLEDREHVLSAFDSAVELRPGAHRVVSVGGRSWVGCRGLVLERPNPFGDSLELTSVESADGQRAIWVLRDFRSGNAIRAGIFEWERERTFQQDRGLLPARYDIELWSTDAATVGRDEPGGAMRTLLAHAADVEVRVDPIDGRCTVRLPLAIESRGVDGEESSALAFFCLWSPENNVDHEGYIGLCPDDNGALVGELALPEHDRDLSLTVTPVVGHRFEGWGSVAALLDRLERSLELNQLRGRRVIERLQNRVLRRALSRVAAARSRVTRAAIRPCLLIEPSMLEESYPPEEVRRSAESGGFTIDLVRSPAGTFRVEARASAHASSGIGSEIGFLRVQFDAADGLRCADVVVAVARQETADEREVFLGRRDVEIEAALREARTRTGFLEIWPHVSVAASVSTAELEECLANTSGRRLRRGIEEAIRGSGAPVSVVLGVFPLREAASDARTEAVEARCGDFDVSVRHDRGEAIVTLESDLPAGDAWLADVDAYGGVLLRFDVKAHGHHAPARCFHVSLGEVFTGRGDRRLRGARTFPLEDFIDPKEGGKLEVSILGRVDPRMIGLPGRSDRTITSIELDEAVEANRDETGARALAAMRRPGSGYRVSQLGLAAGTEPVASAPGRTPAVPSDVQELFRENFGALSVRLERIPSGALQFVVEATELDALDPNGARDLPGAVGFVRLAVDFERSRGGVRLVVPLLLLETGSGSGADPNVSAEAGSEVPVVARGTIVAPQAIEGETLRVSAEPLSVAGLRTLGRAMLEKLAREASTSRDFIADDEATRGIGDAMLRRLAAKLSALVASEEEPPAER